MKSIAKMIIAAAMLTGTVAYAEDKEKKADDYIPEVRCGVLYLNSVGLGHVESEEQLQIYEAGVKKEGNRLITNFTKQNQEKYKQLRNEIKPTIHSALAIDWYIRDKIKEGSTHIEAINAYYDIKDDVLRQRSLIRKHEHSQCSTDFKKAKARVRK